MAHQQIELHAEPRTTVRKGLGALRRSGYIPGSIYGPGVEPIPIQVELKAFQGIAEHATPTTAIDLTVGSEAGPRSVFLKDVTWEAVTHRPLHLDFFAASRERPLRTAVPLAFTGEAPAARASDAMLLHPVTQVHVEGLPDNLPESIPVDLSSLTDTDQAIRARDLNLPPGVTLLDDPDELIARVQHIRAAAEEAPAEAKEEAAPTEAPAAEAASQSEASA